MRLRLLLLPLSIACGGAPGTLLVVASATGAQVAGLQPTAPAEGHDVLERSPAQKRLLEEAHRRAVSKRLQAVLAQGYSVDEPTMGWGQAVRLLPCFIPSLTGTIARYIWSLMLYWNEPAEPPCYSDVIGSSVVEAHQRARKASSF